jgi:hypothetical protein
MSMPRARRAGTSLPELLVALSLGLFILHLGFSTLARVRSVQSLLAARTEGLVALRVGRHLLRRELRHARPETDWLADGDTLSLRAFRGVALVCPFDSATVELVVSFSGDRAPDTSKDSVLLLAPDGSETSRVLVAVRAAGTGCAPESGRAMSTWELDAEAPPGTVVAKIYERGSYHLGSAALRYRRGSSGRQPLTPEAWSTARWTLSERALGLELRPRDALVGPAWRGFVSAREAP